MELKDHIEVVFREPEQWGLRGDSFLWREIRDQFNSNGIPDSPQEFVGQVVIAFEQLTGEALFESDQIFVKRYEAGGMSSGQVDAEWWRAKGIPLLRRQFIGSQ